jgi:dolichol kinase
LSLIVPFGMLILGQRVSLLLLVPLSLIALGADVLRVRSEGFSAFIDRIFGPLMRDEERPPVGSPVVINGATWVLVTATILVILFPVAIAVPAFVMFMIGDAAAALVGRRYGRTFWGDGPRTIEGSAAFLIAGIGIMAAFPSVPFWIGAASAAAGSLAEAMPRPFNDNVRVPIVTAAVLTGLEVLFLDRSVSLLLGAVSL